MIYHDLTKSAPTDWVKLEDGEGGAQWVRSIASDNGLVFQQTLEDPRA